MKIPFLKRTLLAPALIFLAVAGISRADLAPIDTSALSTLAVQDHGRKKPYTTFAYEALLTLSGTAALPFKEADGTETKLTPERVTLDLWLAPQGWDERPVIMVTFRALKKELGLPLETEQKLFTYQQLISNKALLALLDDAQKVEAAGDKDKLTSLQKEAEHLGERLRLFQDLVDGQKQMIVPNARFSEGRWSAIQDVGGGLRGWPATGKAEVSSLAAQQVTGLFDDWSRAYRKGDIDRFNDLTPQLVDALRQLAPQYYPPGAALKFEHQYMTLHPFRWAWIIYLLALLVLSLTALWARGVGYRLAWLGALVGLAFEIYGLACRVIISGRPPVTDMYETVIWVSFVGMLLATIFEAIYRKRYFFYAGLGASVLTLIIADSQPTILDAAINPLTAVLRNNMWLTIHVLTIVSSYAAFVLTAALGHIALTMSFWGSRYRTQMADLQFFIYRAMQVGVLLLAAGTILGGVWANYSWGRFWGWDPKETWALVTLLCYLAVLHGRLAGWWGGFGLAVGSVACLLSVIMSWYGVNFVLGKGLHSYGFGTGGFSYVAVFACFEVAFVAAVLWWRYSHLPSPPINDAGPVPRGA